MAEILRTNFAFVSVIFALAIGFPVALVTWLLSKALADVPAEDREYKDPPPIAFRVVWWPVQWISHFIVGIISRRASTSLQGRLRQAGLDYTISPAQFYASRVIAAAVVAFVAWWVLDSFDHVTRDSSGLRLSLYAEVMAVAVVMGWIYPAIWLKDRLSARRRELLKTLPFFLDIVTLCVEAGLNLQGAMNQAVAKGPKGVLRDEFQRVLRDIRAGKARAVALRDMADRLKEPSIANFSIAVIQAESMGVSLGPVLRAQADQRRTERFLRAEKLAMEAPVKMLFPLIAFIFPCTFIVLFFPIVMKFINSGM